MASKLKDRVGRLEGQLKPSCFAGMEEFRFIEFSEPLPEGTIVPEGARVVADFFEDHCFANWRGQPCLTFRSGYYRERITNDPDDQGGILPVADDPILHEYEQAALAPSQSSAPAAEEPPQLPPDVAALYEK